ncbi:four helix bundle protein [bacterium]|nr:four helix bundle protein [bacterium]
MYKKLQVWQKSMDLLPKIYLLTEKFPKSEEYNLKSQIKRAIVSVPLNIAEGKYRYSSKDFIHFLNIAQASLIEVDVAFQIAVKLKFIDNYDEVQNDINELSKMLSSLIKKFNKT